MKTSFNKYKFKSKFKLLDKDPTLLREGKLERFLS